MINILNIFAHKTGSIFVKDAKKKIGILNMRILKILEEDEGIIVTPGSFIGYKIILCILFSIGGLLFGSSLFFSMLLGIGGGIAGYFLPDILINLLSVIFYLFQHVVIRHILYLDAEQH